MKNFKSTRVLITGAARGIGQALASAFAAQGAELVLTDVDEVRLADAQQSLTADGARAYAVSMDVTDPKSVAAARERIHEETGPIAVLVNNAGVVFAGAFLDVPLEKHLRTYRVNVDGVANVTHTFLPDLLAQREAHLINIASIAGYAGVPYCSTYASSKWAVIGLSESIRQELRHQGKTHVGVTTVCPGFVGTGMFDGATPLRLTKMLKPSTVARLVIEAVQKDQAFVYAPKLIRITPFLVAALPLSLSDKLSDLLGATTSMIGWRGH